jgi:hypothetical protein
MNIRTNRQHRGTSILAAPMLLLAIGSPAGAAVISDSIQQMSFTEYGGVITYTLNGIQLDVGSHFTITPTCTLTPTMPVVNGTRATWTATCGSYDVALAVELLSPLPSLPLASGGFEFTYSFTNTTGGALPLDFLYYCDTDLMGAGSDVAGYDPALRAVYNWDAVADPDTLTAMTSWTDQPGATYSYDTNLLGLADGTLPLAGNNGPFGPGDTAFSMGYQMSVPGGDSATIKYRMMYARGVTSVPEDFDFSSCYAVPPSACQTGEKSILSVKNLVDDTLDSLQWKLINTTGAQSDFADPTGDGDYSLCVYENGTHIAGAHVASSASKWLPISTKGYKYSDSLGDSSGIRKTLLKGSAGSKSKILIKGAGANLPDPDINAISTPVQVRLHNADNPAACWEADFSNIAKNSSELLKMKLP